MEGDAKKEKGAGRGGNGTDGDIFLRFRIFTFANFFLTVFIDHLTQTMLMTDFVLKYIYEDTHK